MSPRVRLRVGKDRHPHNVCLKTVPFSLVLSFLKILIKIALIKKRMMVLGKQNIEKVLLNSIYFREYFNDIFRSSGFFGETIITPENLSSEILTCFENFIIVWIIREKGCWFDRKRIKNSC